MTTRGDVRRAYALAIIEARDIKNVPHSPALYVEISVSRNKLSTTETNPNTSPTWEHTCSLHAESSSILSLHLKHSRRWFGSSLLGFVDIVAQELLDRCNDYQRATLTLHDERHHEAGLLIVQLLEITARPHATSIDGAAHDVERRPSPPHPIVKPIQDGVESTATVRDPDSGAMNSLGHVELGVGGVAAQAHQGDPMPPEEPASTAQPPAPTTSFNLADAPEEPPKHEASGADPPDIEASGDIQPREVESPMHEHTPPPSRGAEKLLNKIDDAVEKANTRAEIFDLNGTLKVIANGGSASDVIAPLSIFLQSLDVVATTHPFVGIAVLPFRVIVKLELNRRANDRRILTLISQMADMMQYLKQMPTKRISKDHAAPVDNVLTSMRKSISDCGNMIDVYYKKLLIVRVITSLKWQDKFEDFSESFAKLKGDLRDQVFLVIQLTGLEIHSVATSTKAKVDGIDTTLTDVRALLRGYTAFEKDIADFLKRNGGAERSLHDDRFLSSLVKKVEGWREEPESWRENRSVRFERGTRSRGKATSGRYSQEDDQDSRIRLPPPHTLDPAYIPPTRAPPTVRSPSVRGNRAASTSSNAYYVRSTIPGERRGRPATSYSTGMPPTSLAAADSYSGYATNAQPSLIPPQASVVEASDHPPRLSHTSRAAEADIVSYGGSAQAAFLEQYRDEIRTAIQTDLSVLIQRNEEGWKFTLSRFEVELKTHIDRGTQQVLEELAKGPHIKLTDPTLRHIWKEEKWTNSVDGPKFIQGARDHLEQNVPQSERWAIDFLAVPYRRAILHAVDPDYSGFVSVSEANQFTALKPEEQSLLVWFAYNAVAWLYEANQCHHEIVEAREKLASAFDLSAPLPTRRGRDDVIAAVHDLQAQIVNGIEEALLTSLLVTEQQIIQMKEVTALNQLLEAGFKRKRDILSDNLKAIQWDISGPNALRAVIGSQGIENYVLMLSSLVVSRIVDYLISTNLEISPSRRDLSVVQRIFGTRMALIQIFTAIDERVRYPQDSGIPVEKFAFGLFTRWVPEDVPLESDMPNLAISPSADHRVQDSEDSSIADAPRTQIEAAQRRTVITPSESEDAAQDATAVRDSPERASEFYEHEHARHRGGRRWSRKDRSLHRVSRTSSVSFDDPSGYRMQPTAIYGYPSTYTLSLPSYTPEPSRRPPSPSQRPTWFPPFVVVEDLNPERVADWPLMSLILANHDTFSSEYDHYIYSVLFAFQYNPITRLVLRQRAGAAQLIIDAWNHHFFIPRCVYFRLSRVERILRRDGSYRYDSENEDDFESPHSRLQGEEYDDGDEDNQYAPSMNTRLAPRRKKITYRLLCLSLAARNPIPVPVQAPGYHVFTPAGPPTPPEVPSPVPVPPAIIQPSS